MIDFHAKKCLYCEVIGKGIGSNIEKNGHFCEVIPKLIMVNSFLVDVIKALSKDERKDVLLFIQGHSIQTGKNLDEELTLYNLIAEVDFNSLENELDKEVLYKKMYKDEKPIKGKLEKVMVELNKIIELLWYDNQSFKQKFQIPAQTPATRLYN
ncbi:MAG TPA: hypothetical protein VK168_10250 [Saprospiraceae bacterium]|nr:hypothetical protein [Saprospiraceae bacterium]